MLSNFHQEAHPFSHVPTTYVVFIMLFELETIIELLIQMLNSYLHTYMHEERHTCTMCRQYFVENR